MPTNWKKKDIESKIKSVTGVGDEQSNLGAIVGTFVELTKLAKWDASKTVETVKKEEVTDKHDVSTAGGTQQQSIFGNGKLGISYTINLNLPATTEIDVFNAIFRSLRDNLLREQ